MDRSPLLKQVMSYFREGWKQTRDAAIDPSPAIVSILSHESGEQFVNTCMTTTETQMENTNCFSSKSRLLSVPEAVSSLQGTSAQVLRRELHSSQGCTCVRPWPFPQVTLGTRGLQVTCFPKAN